MKARVVRLGEKVAGFIEAAVKAAVAEHQLDVFHAAPATPDPPVTVTLQTPLHDILNTLGAVTRDHILERQQRVEREFDATIRGDVQIDPERDGYCIRLVAHSTTQRDARGRQKMLAKAFAFVTEGGLRATLRLTDARSMDDFARLWFVAVDAAWKCLADQLERQRVVSIQEVLV